MEYNSHSDPYRSVSYSVSYQVKKMSRPKNFTRDKVLEKALPVFWQHGFTGTSLHDLECATGVNKSGLYAEFENKQDLYLACLRHYFQNSGGAAILEAKPYGWENIEQFFRLQQGCPVTRKGCFGVASILELSELSAEAREVVYENFAQLKSMFVMNIEAEETTMAAEKIAELLTTLFFGLSVEVSLLPPGDWSDQKIKCFMQVLRSL
jgi:TetR/AcrR family transcriptional regulator, copper-responsive repressor